jgi:hypothetical protein
MSTIRTAFENSIELVVPSVLSVMVWEALLKKPKLSRDAQRGWSTNLSFRTYNALKNQGVLA